MRAISVRMPWAWALLNGKDIENRGNPWPLGEYALHASKLRVVKRFVPTQFWEEWVECRSMAREAGLDWSSGAKVTYGDMHAMSGAIIGVLHVTECVTAHVSPWFVGPFGLVIADVRPLVRPIPCKGMLGPWIVPSDIEAAVRQQLEEA